MKRHVPFSIASGLFICAALAWGAGAYTVRVRNNSATAVELEFSQVSADQACDHSGSSMRVALAVDATHDLVCPSPDAAAFCIRSAVQGSPTDWTRIDCSDHPLEDVLELNLFGR
jgi:hypothetical protein